MPDGISFFLLLKGDLNRKRKDLVTTSQKPDLSKLKIKRAFWEGGQIDTTKNTIIDSIFVEMRMPGVSSFTSQESVKGKFEPNQDFFLLNFIGMPLTNDKEKKIVELHLEIPYGLKNWELTKKK